MESKRKCLKVVLKSVAYKSLVVWSSFFLAHGGVYDLLAIRVVFHLKEGVGGGS